jgi:outer membrane protein OmpU
LIGEMKMKKLLCTAAVCGLAVAAANPAQAEDGLSLELGGYFKGYVAYVDQDDDGGDVNSFDIIRDTEVHFGGETTLDNGLTVGVHIEAEADGEDSFGVDESYAYFSGGWGRVNFGDEDGASYLLQVEAPSADDNIDGLRQYVQPVNYTALGVAGLAGIVSADGLDYDTDISGKSSKITYLSPVLNGFQLGASVSPDTDPADDLEGIGTDDVPDDTGHTYELAARYEGQFNNVGVILGAGFVHADLEEDGALDDDRQAWNVGADFDIGPFGVGAAYVEDDHNDTDDEEIIVLGVDYTTGPFKLGASYYDSDNTGGLATVDTQRYSGGVVYTYGPGMTFRGSVGVIDHDVTGADDADATYVTLGTQINF